MHDTLPITGPAKPPPAGEGHAAHVFLEPPHSKQALGTMAEFGSAGAGYVGAEPRVNTSLLLLASRLAERFGQFCTTPDKMNQSSSLSERSHSQPPFQNWGGSLSPFDSPSLIRRSAFTKLIAPSHYLEAGHIDRLFWDRTVALFRHNALLFRPKGKLSAWCKKCEKRTHLFGTTGQAPENVQPQQCCSTHGHTHGDPRPVRRCAHIRTPT